MRNKLIFSIFFIFLLFILYSCDNPNKKVQINEAIAKTFIESWNAHDINKLLSLFAENCLYEEVASGRRYSTKEGIEGYAKSTLSGVPDSKFEIVTFMADKEKAMVEWIWKGTNSVGWEEMGIPATGKYFEIRGVSVMLIENNLIRRNSDYWDWDSFITGIGVN